MKQRTASRLAWSMLGFSVLLSAVAIWLAIVGEGDLGFDITATLFATVPFPLVGAMIASRFPRNAIGWLFITVGVLQSMNIFTFEYATYALVTRPGSLPLGEVAAWITFWSWMPSLGLLTTFLFLLFPNGRVPSPRWRWVGWVAGIGIGLVMIGAAGGALTVEAEKFVGEASFPVPTWALALALVGGGMVLVGSVGSVTSLVIRFRRSRGEEREQLKWVVYAGVFVFLAIAIQFLPITFPVWLEPLLGVALLAVPVASGIAILKYRLYDIDVVINKTVVYGVLAAFVTAVYLAIVVGIGALVGSRSNLFLSIVATALIAAAFQPVRQRARHLANRIVYGKRATPYEVMSEFADRVAGTYSLEDVLPRMAKIAAEGTGADRVEVWVRVGDELQFEASWPAKSDSRTIPLVGPTELPSIPGAERAVPVVHQSEVLGAIAVTMPRTEALTPAGEKLLGDLASQAGLVLRNVRLIEELRASRQRLVTAQDEARRRLERNIHDGAQQQLVALAVKLRLAETTTRKDADRGADLVAEARRETQDALENLRDLARGIYPPLLADKGLAAALDAQARKAPFPVDVQPDGVGRYPAEAEATAYFCVLEALQNTAKYAEASSAVIRLVEDNGLLVFSVRDDGRGFDSATTPRGSGLQNMADRLDAVGGSVEVKSAPGEGTTVTGRIPVPEAIA